MRASEFISESELKQLNEKGFKDAMKGVGKSVAGGAANFAHGAGMLSDKDMEKINDKLGTAEKTTASNAASVMQGQIKRIQKFAKKEGLKAGDKKYDAAITGAVNNMFTALRVPKNHPKFAKAIAAITTTAIQHPENIKAAMKKIVEPMMKIKGQGGAKTPTTNPKLKNATPFTASSVPGPDGENHKSVMVDREGNGKWKKYVDKEADGIYKLDKSVDAMDMKDFVSRNAAKAVTRELLTVDDKFTKIGFAYDDQDDALAQDAENDAEEDAENADQIEQVAQAGVKHISELPKEEQEKAAENFVAQMIKNHGYEEQHVEKLKELINQGLGKDDGATSTGVDLEKLKSVIKKNLLANPKGFGKDRDAAADFIQYNLENNGIKDEDQIADISDQIMSDPQLGFNYKPAGQFRAEVYAPEGRAQDSIAYSFNDGKWNQWRVASNSTWEYMGSIEDPEEIAAIRQTLKSSDTKPKPLTFNKDKKMPKYYNVTSKVK